MRDGEQHGFRHSLCQACKPKIQKGVSWWSSIHWAEVEFIEGWMEGRDMIGRGEVG